MASWIEATWKGTPVRGVMLDGGLVQWLRKEGPDWVPARLCPTARALIAEEAIRTASAIRNAAGVAPTRSVRFREGEA